MSIPLSESLRRPAASVADTLAQLLRAHWAEAPDSQITEIDYAGGRACRSTAELHDRALAILSKLQAVAVPGRSDIVICVESALDFVPAAWACILGGYSCLPWHMAKTTGEKEIGVKLEALMQALNDPVLVTTPPIRVRMNPLLPYRFSVIVCIDSETEPTAKLAETSAACPGDGAFLILTSGTTGTPKVAIIEYRCLLNRHRSRQSWLSEGPRLWCFPFDSVTGLWSVVHTGGAGIFVQPEWVAKQPLNLLEIVQEFRLSSLYLSTSIAAQIIEAADNIPPDCNLPSLAHVSFGAETIVPEIVRKLATRLRQLGAVDLTLSFGYGMTETGLICCTPSLSCDEAFNLDGSPVSVGGCMSGWSLRIVDDAGMALPEGAVGNVEVWSEAKLFSGYRNAPAPTEASFSADGWFKTGDLGLVEGGTLRLTGREKATIIINARNIALDAIETSLRACDGICRGLVAAAPVRSESSETDELAIFFVPRAEDVEDNVCRRILRETASRFGVGVKHLVPVNAADFPMTATGKIRRDELVRRYLSGAYPAHALLRHRNAAAERLTDAQRSLMSIWRTALGLDFTPSLDDNFFDLGGDSLASAGIIFAVEEKFGCEFPLEAFFERPTIANMDALLKQHAKPSPSFSIVQSSESSDRLLHKLQSFSGSWEGQRLFRDSLLVGFNTGGYRVPIFWVCQEYREASQLAKHLGHDQPLYAMRSCVGIIEVKDYTAEVLENICNRYLWEVLALSTSPAFILGGDCQGGILALAMARRLKQMRRTPLLLALQEWSYSYGRYTEPTLLVYGEQSYAAEIYRHPGKSKINWRDDFPRSVVASVPGKHGELSWKDESVVRLAEILSEQCGPATPATRQGDHGLVRQLAASGAKVKELAATLAMREAEVKELRANLKSRARKERQLRTSRSWRVTAPFRAVSYGLRKWLTRKSNRSNLAGRKGGG